MSLANQCNLEECFGTESGNIYTSLCFDENLSVDLSDVTCLIRSLHI